MRPTLSWVRTEANLQRARALLIQIKARITTGDYCFAEHFPGYRARAGTRPPLNVVSCTDVFDTFPAHGESRVARGDLSITTLASHRRILDTVWRPRLGCLPFLGVRHSMLVQIADAHTWRKKTYNNALSVLRRAFDFGY